MDWYLWLCFAVVLIILELLTPGIFFFCFAVGAVGACLISLFNLPVWTEILVFVAVSIACVYFAMPLVKKYMQKNGTINSNVDELIGEIGVIDKIEDGKFFAKISGEVWTVVSVDTLALNDSVKIKEVRGNRLIVEKVK
jgi:membrane protein implicated in regulation of membrane protease activity